MLRLLAQRGEAGYEDIAALKGIGVEEVRAQARAAVAQLEEEGLPPPALPLEPGSAPSVARERERRAREDEAPTETAEPKSEPGSEAEPAPERAAPQSPAPAPTAGEAPPRAKSAPAGGRSSGRRRGLPKLPPNPALRWGLAGALSAAVILAAVLLFGGGGDGGSDEQASGGAGGDNATREAAAGETRAILRPVGDSEARGRALFGRLKNDLALQVVASDLEPTAGGEVYAIWVAQSPRRMLPLAFTPVRANGRLAVQFKVPLEVLAYLAQEVFTDVAVTRVDRKRLEASLNRATKAKRAPDYTGTEVLRGRITGPIVGAAKEAAGK